MEHWKSTSMLNAVETHENHQHPHKSKETCCHYANSHEDDDDENSDYSEYSDSEDVPSENKYGYNIWDYFYILKSDVVKGLDKCGMIFRKENKMLRRFERHGNEQFTFLPTNKVIERLINIACTRNFHVSFSIPSTAFIWKKRRSNT